MKRPIIHYNPKLKKRARKLRNNSTKSEIFQEIDDVLMAIEHAVFKQKKRLGL